MVTGVGGIATKVGPRLAAKGIVFKALVALLSLGMATDVAGFVLDASTANTGADFADETEKANATVSAIHRRWRSGAGVSAGEMDYLRRMGARE